LAQSLLKEFSPTLRALKAKTLAFFRKIATVNGYLVNIKNFSAFSVWLQETASTEYQGIHSGARMAEWAHAISHLISMTVLKDEFDDHTSYLSESLCFDSKRPTEHDIPAKTLCMQIHEFLVQNHSSASSIIKSANSLYNEDLKILISIWRTYRKIDERLSTDVRRVRSLTGDEVAKAIVGKELDAMSLKNDIVFTEPLPANAPINVDALAVRLGALAPPRKRARDGSVDTLETKRSRYSINVDDPEVKLLRNNLARLNKLGPVHIRENVLQHSPQSGLGALPNVAPIRDWALACDEASAPLTIEELIKRRFAVHSQDDVGDESEDFNV
jgi:hypothetical protein